MQAIDEACRVCRNFSRSLVAIAVQRSHMPVELLHERLLVEVVFANVLCRIGHLQTWLVCRMRIWA